MSSSKIEEVGEARRSMNAICGVMVYRLASANRKLLTFC